MNIYWFLGFIGWTVTVFGAGMFTEYKFNLAREVSVADAQAKRAGEGQAEIIKFNQKWNEAHAKDDCINKPIDPALRKLLY